MKSAVDKEYGNDRITPRHDYSLNSPSARNCNLREQAIAPTTEEGVVRILVVSRATGQNWVRGGLPTVTTKGA